MTRVNGEERADLRGADRRPRGQLGPRARADRLFDLIKEDRTADISKQLCQASGLAD